MKHIVIMCDAYIPKPSPNGICVSYIANQLAAEGQDVCVVTAKNQPDQLDREVIDGVLVCRVKPGFVGRTLMHTEGRDGRFALLRRKAALQISRLGGAVNAMRYPLNSPRLVRNYLRVARRIHKQKEIDILICCYHKIEAVAAGMQLKKRYPEMKLIVYSLDAISGGLIFPVLRSMKIPVRSLKRWESRIFHVADALFAMESHRSFYEAAEYAPYADKIQYVDIPLLRMDRLAPPRQSNPVRLVYTGSMHKKTANPLYFLSLLPKLHSVEYIFEIYGTVSDDIQEILEQYTKENPKVHLKDRVPYEAIGDIQQNADILVNFGNANPCMIPCKIFEYLSTGKKILSFTHSDKDASVPYLQKYPNAIIVDENGDEVYNANVIEKFLQVAPETITEQILRETYPKNTAEYFCRQVEKLFDYTDS